MSKDNLYSKESQWGRDMRRAWDEGDANGYARGKAECEATHFKPEWEIGAQMVADATREGYESGKAEQDDEVQTLQAEKRQAKSGYDNLHASLVKQDELVIELVAALRSVMGYAKQRLDGSRGDSEAHRSIGIRYDFAVSAIAKATGE